MEFNIGDSVYIRPHTYEEAQTYADRYNLEWVPDMDDCEDSVGVVIDCNECDGYDEYLVDCDGDEWWFADSSLEVFEPTYKVGTMIRIRHHTQDERVQYDDRYNLLWMQQMNDFEGRFGMITQSGKTHGRYMYQITIDADHFWFVETSLALYDIF